MSAKEVIEQLQKLSYQEQIKAVKEYIEHEKTDLQVVIQTWGTTTEIISSNVDLLDGLEEQLEISTIASDLVDVVMEEVNKAERELDARA